MSLTMMRMRRRPLQLGLDSVNRFAQQVSSFRRGDQLLGQREQTEPAQSPRRFVFTAMLRALQFFRFLSSPVTRDALECVVQGPLVATGF